MDFRPNDGDKDKFNHTLHHYDPIRTPILPEQKYYEKRKRLECNSIRFNGSSSYINCGNESSLKPTNFSIITDIYAESLGADVYNNFIISNGDDYNNAKGFGLMCGDDKVSFWIGDDTINRKNTIAETFLINNWYNVIGIYEEGIGSKLYVNGNLKGSSEQFKGSLVYDSLDFFIGKLKETYYHFHGIGKKVQLYERVLSPTECLEISKNNSISHENLVLDLPLKTDCSGDTTIKDLSGNGNNGTLHNCKWNCDWIRKKHKVI